MNRFVWRLQRVLDLKVREEKFKKNQLLELTEKLLARQRDLYTQQQILKNLLCSVADSRPAERISQQEFIIRCARTNRTIIDELKGHIRELEKQRLEKINEYLKVRKLKRSLEKLRAKAKEEFIKEQERIEQRELDDGATISFVRNARQKKT
jgi:flagellar FliJ protein